MPEIDEQRAIAAALSDVDGLLSALDALIAKKRAIKTAAMQSLLTGRVRLPGFTGEWMKMSLRNLEQLKYIELGRGQVISQKDIINNPGNYPIYSSSVQNEGLFGRYGSYMFDEEMITWSVDGGGNFFYRPKHKFSVTNVSGFIRVRSDKIHTQYFAYALQQLHSTMVFDYTLKAHPSVIRDIYVVPLPKIDEQRAIAAALADMDAEIAALESRREKVRQVKQGMMQVLLTGKVRLVTPAI
jgi:type I restriction enzyme S subunit